MDDDPTRLALQACHWLALAICLVGFFLRRARHGAAPPLGGVTTGIYRPHDLVAVVLLAGLFYFLGAPADAANGADALPDESATADPRGLSAGVLVDSMIFQGMLATVVVLLVATRQRPAAWLGLRWTGWRRLLWIVPVTVGGMLVLMTLLGLAGYMDWLERIGVEPVQDAVRLLQESTDPLVLVLMVLAAVVVAPICEEIVFRGYLFPAVKRFTGAWPAALATGLVFSAAHGQLAPLLPLAVLGVALAWIYEHTRSIWAPIAVHLAFNGFTVAVQLGARLAQPAATTGGLP